MFLRRFFGYEFGDKPTRSTPAQTSGRRQLALLADLDHCGAALLIALVRYLENRFDVYYRRAYGAYVHAQIDDLGLSALKPVATFPAIQGKPVTDMQLTLDATEEIPRADAFCIVSRDADFIPLAQRLRERGKYVLVAGSAPATSVVLRRVANEFLDLDKLPAPDLPVLPYAASSTTSSPGFEPALDDPAVNELFQALNLSYERVTASSTPPTLRALEAAHRAAHPEFNPRSYRFPKGDPPKLIPADCFVDLLRSAAIFRMERVPGTKGREKDYFLTRKQLRMEIGVRRALPHCESRRASNQNRNQLGGTQ